MQLRPVIAFILLCLAALSAAQGSVFLTFPSAGPREVWVQTGLPSAPPTTGIKTEQSSVDLPLGSAKPTDAVFVWDKKSGNLASKTVKDVQTAGKWEVQEKDFIDVAQVTVKVQHDGKPVAAAMISLNDGRRTFQELLDPSTKGEASFFAVRPGSLKARVEYKAQGKNAQPVTQILEAPLKRSDAIPTLTMALPEAAEVVGASPVDQDPEAGAPADGGDEAEKTDTSQKSKKEGPKEEGGNPFGLFVAYILAIGIAGGVAWFAIQYAKKNPTAVASKLEQLGAQVPKPGDEDLTNAAPVVPMPKRPEPPQKIMLDDAAPDPLSSVAPVAVQAVSLVTGQPRLVSAGGDSMDLPEGETVVGREVGLGLSLLGESTVSRRHAQLVRTGDSVVVRDLGSTNGTFVNGAKIAGDTPLSPGANVQFGEVRFRYEG